MFDFDARFVGRQNSKIPSRVFAGRSSHSLLDLDRVNPASSIDLVVCLRVLYTPS